MNKVIKIHGCSGAGKTTAVRELLTHSENIFGQYTVIANSAKKIEAYQIGIQHVERPIFIIGSYQNNCGGVDTITDVQDVMDLVDKYADQGHVVYEGLLQSTYYGRMGEWSRKWGDNFIYAFLDTPKEVCVERVIARREANGTKTKFNPDMTRQKWDTVQHLALKLENNRVGADHKVVTLRHNEEMVPQFREMLK